MERGVTRHMEVNKRKYDLKRQVYKLMEKKSSRCKKTKLKIEKRSSSITKKKKKDR